MRSRTTLRVATPARVRAHPAVVALRATLPGWDHPSEVVVLKAPRPNGDGGVFRLTGTPSVVAKHIVGPTGRVERLVYESLGACLGPVIPELLGIHDDDASAWLLIEDVPGRRPDAKDPATGRLLARAMASIHDTRVPSGVRALLPDRGIAESSRVAGRARSRLCKAATRLDRADRDMLGEIVDLLDTYEALTPRLEVVTKALGTTLVHFDSVAKNAIVTDGDRAVLVDWEFAGIGPPPVDYYRWDISAYASARAQPNAEPADLGRHAVIGRALFTLRSIEWDGANVLTPWPERALRHLATYRDRLRTLLPSLEEL